MPRKKSRNIYSKATRLITLPCTKERLSQRSPGSMVLRTIGQRGGSRSNGRSPTRAAKWFLTPFHFRNSGPGLLFLGGCGHTYLRGVSVANAIHVIVPYRHASTWVFDDPRVGLSQEPFVSGIPEMIDTMVADIPNAEKGFRLCSPQRRFRATKSSWRRCEQNMRVPGIGGLITTRRAGSVLLSFSTIQKRRLCSTPRQRLYTLE